MVKKLNSGVFNSLSSHEIFFSVQFVNFSVAQKTISVCSFPFDLHKSCQCIGFYSAEKKNTFQILLFRLEVNSSSDIIYRKWRIFALFTDKNTFNLHISAKKARDKRNRKDFSRIFQEKKWKLWNTTKKKAKKVVKKKVNF